jgi:hypothetical protein
LVPTIDCAKDRCFTAPTHCLTPGGPNLPTPTTYEYRTL